MNKYHARRTATGYPSRLEAQRAGELKLLQRAGKLSNLREQVSVQLTKYVRWRVDFCYDEGIRTVYEEAKGIETEGYRIKKNLWRTHGPGLLRVMKRGPAGRIVCTEEVEPEGKPCNSP